MQVTPRECDKLLTYMLTEVALKRKAKGIKLKYPQAVAIISAAAMDGVRVGKSNEEVSTEARTVRFTGAVSYRPEASSSASTSCDA